MDGQQFSIAIDPPAKMMRIVMTGFWCEETVQRYDHAAREAGARMVAAGCPVKEILALVDARGLGAQAQQTLMSYRERFSTPDRQPKRNATVVASKLFRRQAERIAMPNQRIFENEHEALLWLRGDC